MKSLGWLALIEVGAFDAALFDANLAGVAGPAGVALAARGRPYVGLSGYSAQQQMGAFPGAALFLQKSCVSERLIGALKGILVGLDKAVSMSPSTEVKILGNVDDVL